MRTETLDDISSVAGNFKVILHGGGHTHDYETFSIMDLQGDSYDIVPRSPAFSYTETEALDAGTAFETARRFVMRYRYYQSSKFIVKRITDNNGEVIGYEIRPRHKRFIYGVSDPLELRYLLAENGKVIILIDVRVDPETGLRGTK